MRVLADAAERVPADTTTGGENSNKYADTNMQGKGDDKDGVQLPVPPIVLPQSFRVESAPDLTCRLRSQDGTPSPQTLDTSTDTNASSSGARAVLGASNNLQRLAADRVMVACKADGRNGRFTITTTDTRLLGLGTSPVYTAETTGHLTRQTASFDVPNQPISSQADLLDAQLDWILVKGHGVLFAKADTSEPLDLTLLRYVCFYSTSGVE
jgi:hypothetical protein